MVYIRAVQYVPFSCTAYVSHVGQVLVPVYTATGEASGPTRANAEEPRRGHYSDDNNRWRLQKIVVDKNEQHRKKNVTNSLLKTITVQTSNGQTSVSRIVSHGDAIVRSSRYLHPVRVQHTPVAAGGVDGYCHDNNIILLYFMYKYKHVIIIIINIIIYHY